MIALLAFLAVFSPFIASVWLLTIWRDEVAIWVLPGAGGFILGLWAVSNVVNTVLLNRGKEMDRRVAWAMDRRVAWAAWFLFFGAIVVYRLKNPNLPLAPHPCCPGGPG